MRTRRIDRNDTRSHTARDRARTCGVPTRVNVSPVAPSTCPRPRGNALPPPPPRRRITQIPQYRMLQNDRRLRSHRAPAVPCAHTGYGNPHCAARTCRSTASSSREYSVTQTPRAPARPVRPERCTYLAGPRSQRIPKKATGPPHTQGTELQNAQHISAQNYRTTVGITESENDRTKITP